MIPELYWVVTNPVNTVSDNTWRFESADLAHPFAFGEWTAGHWVFAAAYLVYAAWLGLHLAVGIRLRRSTGRTVTRAHLLADRIGAGATAAVAIAALAAAAVHGTPTGWSAYWLAWYAGFFLIPGIYWAITSPVNTVAGATWAFEDADLNHPFRFSRWTPLHWGFATVYALFATWLGLHLVFGLLRG